MKIKIELGEYYEEGEWYVTGTTEDGDKFGGVGLSIMTAMAEAGLALQMILEEKNEVQN